MTLEKLRFGFVIWLWSCGGPVLVFIIEALFWFLKWKSEKTSKLTSRYECSKNSKVHPIQGQMGCEQHGYKYEKKYLNDLWLKRTFVIKNK